MTAPLEPTPELLWQLSRELADMLRVQNGGDTPILMPTAMVTRLWRLIAPMVLEAAAKACEAIDAAHPPLDCQCYAAAAAAIRAMKGGATLAGPLPLSAQPAPNLIVVTRLFGKVAGGWEAVLGPTDWRAIDHRDGTHTIVVSPELEAQARKLFPGVPVEKGDGG